MNNFDLNIENILENWDVHNGIREIIANAIDEQILTNTSEVEIYKDKTKENVWYIRDYGRGLEAKHFTQKENEQKLKHDNLIGQFGIGLKDAIATFHRKNISLQIKSRFLKINKIKMYPKDGFEDIHTLNVIIEEPDDQYFKGTEFILNNVTDREMMKAKKLFLKFSNVEILDTNKIGEIIQKEEISNIYLNGMKISERTWFFI